ncbi:cryptochrome-1-like isoform X2 [Elgaria multicarinata webbii]|uniref:cryptochrome-1-like isoform X2 n=1 Tax=Elgaria multicarinata webbii TaxID=159646 RepID=UPI002FCD2627
MTHISIHWFRKALRLQDNPALLAAMKDCSEVYPIFILDPWFPKNMRVSVNRWRFLVESLSDLDENLKKLNSRLFVVRGRPAEVFPRLFKKWKVTRLTFEVDTEPYARQRDAEVVTLADEHGVQVIQKVSHTLYDTERIIIENNGRAPLTYTRLQTLLTSLGPPKKPVPAPSLENLKDCNTPVKEDHGMEYGIPSFEELGQDPTKAGPHLYPGGESEALARLDLYMKRTSWVCNFRKPDTSPNSLTPSTTVLSPYVKFGCLSVRTFWWKLTEIYQGGRTGYPFIDAIMTQLRTEGWIHHLARHAVACFLTRGDLWISWEEGQKVFEELLLDADWSLNAGNWQWLSASAFFHQFFRVYSPVAFGKKTDKNGEYIKKYLPFLQKFPSDYIYEPWKAPRSMQERAGCIIGKDYPKPIVVHEEARKRNLERMKAAYARRSPDVAAQAQDKTSKEGANQKRPMASSKAEVQTKKVKTKRS